MIRHKLLSVLFWSIIAAAFIGPGTVTTAAVAGNQFGLSLLWALGFSTLGCIVLQETATRIRIGSGLSLGEALGEIYKGRITLMIGSSVIFGCAAYQTGNMLGSVAGVSLWLNLPGALTSTAIYVSCIAILWFGSQKWIANLLGLVVAAMGICFVYLAANQGFGWSDILTATLIPQFPEGSSLLIIGLAGTTIVPYNLFLASGLRQSQSLGEMRFGMIIAVLLGGIISMAIIISGTAISGEFSFGALGILMASNLGPGAGALVGIGLFAAGFSSSLTAPLASAITAESITPHHNRGSNQANPFYRITWFAVLTIGFGFSISGIKPIPAIILAQALNGFLLPVMSILLILMANDTTLLPRKYRNSRFMNILSLMVVGLTTLIGVVNLGRVLGTVSGLKFVEDHRFMIINIGVAILVSGFTAIAVNRRCEHS